MNHTRSIIRTRKAAKLGLASKLFLVLLMAILVAGMAIGIPFQLGRWRVAAPGQEERDIERVRSALVAAYQQHGSWDFLQEDPRRWSRLLRMSSDVPESIARSLGLRQLAPIARQPNSEFPVARAQMALLDQHHEFLIGRVQLGPEMPLHPLSVDGKVVGWLAVPQRLIAPAPLEEHEVPSPWIIGLRAVLIAALAAVVLTWWLLRPVRHITAATHQLAAGDYTTRLKVSSRDEIGYLAEDVNRLAAALENNERARRAFMADLSHELRTPLTVLSGELEAIQDGVRQLSMERVESLHSEVRTIRKLVDDLYELSLADIGALTYHMAEMDIVEVLRLKLGGFRGRLAERRIELASQIPEREILINGDATRIQQVLGNLLENSLRYTDDGGRLRVSCHCESHRVVIDLEDSEPGVPRELLPHLFERFYRVEDSRNRGTGGAGLGLAICKSVVEAHGGTIRVDESSLGGLWMSLELPTVRAPS